MGVVVGMGGGGGDWGGIVTFAENNVVQSRKNDYSAIKLYKLYDNRNLKLSTF